MIIIKKEADTFFIAHIEDQVVGTIACDLLSKAHRKKNLS